MNPWQPVFKHARTSLLMLAGAIVFGLVLVFGSGYLSDRLSDDLLLNRKQLRVQQTRLAEKEQDLLNVEAHNDQFRALQRQGFVGVPDREDWAEQLLASSKRLGLPGNLAYTLHPPAPMNDGAPVGQAGAAAATVNPDAALMHDLDFELHDIHEEELLDFLRDYRNRVHGRFRVQACRLDAPVKEGFAVKCTLRFFTLPQHAENPAPQV
jgi:hypothetical protein